MNDLKNVESNFLSDHECTLLNGLHLSNQSITSLETANRALIDALASRDEELTKVTSDLAELQVYQPNLNYPLNNICSFFSFIL